MSKSSLKNSDNNPFAYFETVRGSTAVGTDASGGTDIVKIVTGLTPGIEPTSAAGSISIETTTPGDIQFRPNGTGQSTFVNGNVEITDGNLLMTNTAAAGLSGVIEYGGNRFVHNYGTDNTFIGQNSGNFSLTTASATNNTAVGFDSLLDLTTGNQNVAIGSNALKVSTTGSDNVAIGYDALTASVTDNNVVAIGANALKSLNGATGANLAIGYNALTATVTDNQNTGIGYNVLAATNGGSNNTAIGAYALLSSVLGGSNTAIGANALESLNDVSVDNCRYNTAIGMTAGEQLPSGSQNTFIGAKSGWNFLSGTANSNVLIGYNSGSNYTTTESSNIIISNIGTISDNNTIRIGTQGSGDGQQNACNIAGIYGNSPSSPSMVIINSLGDLGSQAIPGGGGFTYTDETSSPVSLVANNGYTANLGTLLTFNMPASVAYGTVFEVIGKGTGLWSIVLSGGQTIKFGNLSGTTSISSTLQYDNVKIVCITADTLFSVVRAVGNLTVL